MKKKNLLVLGILGVFLLVGTAFADVTGDFKVVSATYLNPGTIDGGDVTVSGTVNHGAIQSKKSVVVEIAYTIAYNYTINETEVTFEPGVCTDPTFYNDPKANGANKKKCDNADENSALWKGKTTTVSVTKTFDGIEGMTAITEPTVEKGRLNPKGKITGYNWSSLRSLVPSALVPELPAGAILVSAAIASADYTAYLKDANGVKIADTVVTGTLF